MGDLIPDLQHADTLLILGVVVLAGALAGGLAKRARLPGITGQILIGVLIGRAGLDLFEEEDLHLLEPVTHFALGLMTFTIGSHLNLRRLRNAGKRLGLLLLTEATVVPTIVMAVLLPFVEWWQATLFATLAVSTAPATIVALVKESRARGVFVKTLFAAVALNNLACVFLFEIARAVSGAAATGEATPDAAALLAGPGLQLLWALVIGGVLAIAMHLLSLLVDRGDRLTTASVVSLLLCSGLAEWLGASPLLACMFLGFVQTNITRRREFLVDSYFDNFAPAFLAMFFTLAGMHLSMEHAAAAGGVAVALFFARGVGKLFSSALAMRLAGATDRVRRWLGLALVPQAGVAVGLVVLVQGDPNLAGFADLFTAVVLTVVTANEIVGPVLTRLAISRAGEVDRDRTRLLDFIGEENIQTGLEAATPEEVIEQLTDLLVSSHHLPRSAREPLLASVLAREAQVPTMVGGGLMIPHGELAEGDHMLGVMAICEGGLDLPTPDGEPVRCVVLLATPAGQRDRHLEVLAALARTVSGDPEFKRELFDAGTPAHVYELLHGEEAEHFNYYLPPEATGWGADRAGATT